MSQGGPLCVAWGGEGVKDGDGDGEKGEEGVTQFSRKMIEHDSNKNTNVET